MKVDFSRSKVASPGPRGGGELEGEGYRLPAQRLHLLQRHVHAGDDRLDAGGGHRHLPSLQAQALDAADRQVIGLRTLRCGS